MQILGFSFEKVHAERKNTTKSGKIEVNSNIDIKNITQETLDLVKDKVPMKFNFEFSIDYKPDFADIKLNGAVIGVVEKDIAKEILKKWKDKKISDDIRVPLFNFILTKCNLKALVLEEDFGLPTHVPMPRIQTEDSKNSYTG